MTDTRLSSSAVNSGTAVLLGGTDITFAWKNNINSPVLPGKTSSADSISQVDYVGRENPIVSIQGVFNEKNLVTNGMSVSLWRDFAKLTTSCTIYDDIFFTSGQAISLESMNMARQPKEGDYYSGATRTKGSMVKYNIKGVLTD